MKIRTKLTLRYTIITAAIFCIFAILVYLFSSSNRESEFFRDLKKEGITKANLFLENKVNPETMQSIYMNNREFINEVEVAVYDTSFHLLYHDAKQIDLVKETPQMMEEILRKKTVDFYQGKYQVAGMLYEFKGKPYIITAVAYDGYGFAKLDALRHVLLILLSAGLIILFVVGYFLAKSALNPVMIMIRNIRDITANKLDTRLSVHTHPDELDELAITFNQVLDKLEESFNAQRLFMSNVSHEIRTPMSVIIGEIELALHKERTSESYRLLLENTLSDARNITELLDGLLNLAKASYQPEQIRFSHVRLDEVLLDAREMVLKSHPEYHIDLIFEQDAEDDHLITIDGNAYLLKVAFANLMDNNAKFSENHSSSVQISFFDTKSIIRFSDNGIGIDESEIDKIFKPFYRGANQSYAKGKGIGLALVRKIVLLHKGDIYIHSHKNEGTVFTLEFPHV
ncbi:MAG: ATP-binding protein [Bacteroidales bacterium]